MFKEFMEFAEYEIKAVRAEDTALDEEEQRLRKRLDEIVQMRSNFMVNDEALASYKSACASNRYTCPICFIRHNTTYKMKPAPTDSIKSAFKCPHCDTTIEVQI